MPKFLTDALEIVKEHRISHFSPKYFVFLFFQFLFLIYFIDYDITVVPFFFSPLFPFALHLPSDPHPLPLIS